jgi:hypothetical protein
VYSIFFPPFRAGAGEKIAIMGITVVNVLLRILLPLPGKSQTSKNQSMVDQKNEKEVFALGKKNYILLIIGLAIVMTGFMLMTGGGSPDPNVFNEEVFSTRRITVAPFTVLTGYIFIIYAIMKKG